MPCSAVILNLSHATVLQRMIDADNEHIDKVMTLSEV